MDIQALLFQSKQLVRLLEDPHPGLFSWNEAVKRHLKLVASAGGGSFRLVPVIPPKIIPPGVDITISIPE